jgi:hypothetical protein
MINKLLWLVCITVFAFGCKKISTETTEEENVGFEKVGRSSPIVARLSYGDSIIFKQTGNSSYAVLPVSAPSGAGYYKAIPVGLAIDSITGAINPALSESGLRYKVYKIFNSGVRADSCHVIISGIDYDDGIYEIAKTTLTYDTAHPVYNALPTNILPCSEDDDDDDVASCTFDETDINNDGNDDLPGVIQDKLLINTKTGTIDLEASFHAGVFGSSQPANGVQKDFTFYYRLNDASNRALQKITVRLFHFKTRAQIPDSLIRMLNKRKFYTDTYVNSRGLARIAAVESRPKRPPVIIICSQ